MKSLDKHLFILGSTAVGKTELSLQLAEKTGTEICSFDAFQVYQQMNIGTSKPNAEEQKRAKHHLLNLVNPLEKFSVADFLKYATELDLEKPKIWVGGTGLFYHALHSGLCEAPASDPILLMEMEREPLENLQKEIQQKDPVWCIAADLQNPRRVMRALSVVRQTGIPLSTWQQENKPALVKDAYAVCLIREKEDLHHRIQTRTRQMLQAGWIEETKSLLQNPEWKNSQSFKAIGYEDIARLIENEIDLEKCTTEIINKTQQYAKRQMTWFRKEPNVLLISLEKETPHSDILMLLSSSLHAAST